MIGKLNPAIWQGKRVFLTGHTGFKGAWLAWWLAGMGARVTGYSLAPETDPALSSLLRLDEVVDSRIGDIRDPALLRRAVAISEPDTVLHLAAQPIVSIGYSDPAGTFATNVMGVVNLLEVCREFGSALPILIVSSDKCYRNNDEGRAFRVEDPLGGHDPYSASKAGTEIVASAYASSYFNRSGTPLLATARAGNVVGGGDWSVNRLLPDGARSFSVGKPLILRNPLATRPWQHVLEPLYGYLVLVQAMFEDRSFARAWNFGPTDHNHRAVGPVAELFAKSWGDDAQVEISSIRQEWKEAEKLDLDCSETHEQLSWKPVLDLQTTIEWTAAWYRETYGDMSTSGVRDRTQNQIDQYVRLQSNNT